MAALAYVFARWVDWRPLLDVLRDTDPVLLGLALLTALLVRWLLAVQFRTLAAATGSAISVLRIMQAHLISSFFAVVAPGEVVSSGVSWHYLARGQLSYAQTGAILVYLKLTGYAAIALLALCGAWLESRLEALHVTGFALLVLLVCVLGAIPFFHAPTANLTRRIAEALARRLPLGRWRELVTQLPGRLLVLHELPANKMAWPLLLAFLINATGALALGLGLQAAGVSVPWHVWLWLRAVLTVVQAAPVSIAGTGVRELTMVFLLHEFYGIPSATVIAASLLMLGINLFYGLLIGGVLFLLDRGNRPAHSAP